MYSMPVPKLPEPPLCALGPALGGIHTYLPAYCWGKGFEAVELGRQTQQIRSPDLGMRKRAGKHLGGTCTTQVLPGSDSAEPLHATGINICDTEAHRAPSGALGRHGSDARFLLSMHTL